MDSVLFIPYVRRGRNYYDRFCAAKDHRMDFCSHVGSMTCRGEYNAYSSSKLEESLVGTRRSFTKTRCAAEPPMTCRETGRNFKIRLYRAGLPKSDVLGNSNLNLSEFHSFAWKSLPGIKYKMHAPRMIT